MTDEVGILNIPTPAFDPWPIHTEMGRQTHLKKGKLEDGKQKYGKIEHCIMVWCMLSVCVCVPLCDTFGLSSLWDNSGLSSLCDTFGTPSP